MRLTPSVRVEERAAAGRRRWLLRLAVALVVAGTGVLAGATVHYRNRAVAAEDEAYRRWEREGCYNMVVLLYMMDDLDRAWPLPEVPNHLGSWRSWDGPDPRCRELGVTPPIPWSMRQRILDNAAAREAPGSAEAPHHQ